MKIEKKIELSNNLMELELLNKKASVVCNDLLNDYFGIADPEPFLLKAYYDDGETRTHIVISLLYNMNELIQKLQELIDGPELKQEAK